MRPIPDGRFFGGYQFNKHFAIEGGFVDLGKVTIDAVSNGSGAVFAAGPVRATAEADGFGITAVGSLPLSKRVDLFAKGGLFAWDVDTSVRDSAGPVAAALEDNGTDATFGFGGEFHAKQVRVRVEWERFQDLADAEDVDRSR